MSNLDWQHFTATSAYDPPCDCGVREPRCKCVGGEKYVPACACEAQERLDDAKLLATFGIGERDKCMIVVNDETGETCQEPADIVATLPLEPRADDAAGRERRLTVVGFCAGHWQQRQESRLSEGLQWFPTPDAATAQA